MQGRHWRLCAWLGLACTSACSGGDDVPSVGDPTGGTTSESSGGSSSTTGGEAASTGGVDASTGGMPGTGGVLVGETGGTASGGTVSPRGGASTGGGMGGNAQGGGSASEGGGGSSKGGMNTGGKGGGISSGGAHLGGTSSGGRNQGGSTNGGRASGGANSGGKANGGTNAGGSAGSMATGGSAGGGDCPEVEGKLCGMVAQHNAARASVMPVPTTPLPEMTWNAAAAAAAQSWAEECMFSHNTQGYGQNIYASTGGSSPSPKAVVDSWASEAKNYNYSANSCSGTCGHYTQVVWRTSIGVGCGVKACTVNSPFSGAQNWYIVVCNYAPPGNVNNQRPY